MKKQLLLVLGLLITTLVAWSQADMVLSATQTNTGPKTFLNGTLLLRNAGNTFSSQFTNTNTAARTYSLPDFSGGVLVSGGVNNLSGTTNFTSTGTINFSASSFSLNTTTLKIVDGNQATGKVLTSDATGFASWKPLSLQWATNGTNISYSSGTVGVGIPVNAESSFQIGYSGNADLKGPSIKNFSAGTYSYAELRMYNNAGADRFAQLFYTGSNYAANANVRPNAAGIYSGGSGGISFVTDDAAAAITFATNNTTRMILDPNGNVGIGTALASNPNGYKLAVNGKIGARDVQVETSSATWPDYVFAPHYSLPPLATVERYIKENNHLENVPSAVEIEKEGHNLGEMDKILLKKIEELTLYLIQQQKEIDELKKKLESKQ